MHKFLTYCLSYLINASEYSVIFTYIIKLGMLLLGDKSSILFKDKIDHLIVSLRMLPEISYTLCYNGLY